ncbi:MAG: pyruvate dehydrogenase, partial [candidate division NC10 bacterium]|nr:pyruvate dehydrogenase [candidate division NC10 bacterium]
MKLDGGSMLQMYRTMLRIRLFEERVDELVLKGQIHGTT